jgi:hypothetical protein
MEVPMRHNLGFGILLLAIIILTGTAAKDFQGGAYDDFIYDLNPVTISGVYTLHTFGFNADKVPIESVTYLLTDKEGVTTTVCGPVVTTKDNQDALYECRWNTNDTPNGRYVLYSAIKDSTGLVSVAKSNVVVVTHLN